MVRAPIGKQLRDAGSTQHDAEVRAWLQIKTESGRNPIHPDVLGRLLERGAE